MTISGAGADRSFGTTAGQVLLALLGGVAVRRRGGGRGALVLGVVLAACALLALALVAFALSFTQP